MLANDARSQTPPPSPASITPADSLCDARLSDAQLLERFFKSRDEAAFAVLVARHGPLVLGVCRRILADENDVHDAFQATFLVLVKKGAALRQADRLANWLYGVASRTARKFKALAARRARCERQASTMTTSSPVGEMTFEQLRAILDEEIAQLPDKYALPLVLCYLEGKTNAEAAAQLGWPEGSMSRRLSKAREMLRSRLSRRGLALSVVLMAAMFPNSAFATVPVQLAKATVAAGALVAKGARFEQAVSPAAAKVAAEVMQGISASARISLPAAIALALVGVTLPIFTIVGCPSSQVAGWEAAAPGSVQITPASSSAGAAVHGAAGASRPLPTTAIPSGIHGGCGAPMPVAGQCPTTGGK